MSFIVIGRRMISLPIATRIDAKTLEDALSVVKGMLVTEEWKTVTEEDGSESGERVVMNDGYQAWFLIDEQTCDIKRLYHNADEQLCVTDSESAFEVLGTATDYKYYEGEPDGTA